MYISGFNKLISLDCINITKELRAENLGTDLYVIPGTVNKIK